MTGGFKSLNGDSYAAATITTGAEGCFRIFPVTRAIKGGMVLESVAIVTKPQYGSLIRPSKSSFHYKPRAGFKGLDSFGLKICGRQNGRSGCATVTYSVNVK
jgi:hypothetical protein